LILSVAASHSLGNWPFYWSTKESDRTPGDTVFFSTEDGVADTLVPRLISLGADLARIHFVDGKADWKDTLHRIVLNDADVITQAIRDRNARLAVFDPFQGFLPPKTKMNDMETVRPVVDALIRIAQETRCCVVLLGHLNKAKQESAAYKFIGSVDWFAAARSVMLITKDPEAAPDGRLFFQVKNSLTGTPPGVRFDLAEKLVPPFLWGLSTEQTAEEIMAGDTGAPKIRDAEIFLYEELAYGARPVEELEEAAKKAKIAWRTVWRAKGNLKVKARKAGFQEGWVWELPPKNAE